MKGLIRGCFFLFIFTGVGCSAPGLEHYDGRSPAFIPEKFFQGSLQAHGIVKNRSGEVTRTFNATIEASWQGSRGLLKERFEFDDGEIQYRNWQLTPQEDASGTRVFYATAEDVIGTAELRVRGNAAFMRYVLDVPYKDSTIELTVDDRMYLTTDNVLIGESELRKWGFRVGEIVLTITKSPPGH
ncbi:DUF3833 domain-containing protein [Microbulbifer sp. SA54]|uniref:DUF3833 domain-containing protein n=1 Tax=Microbulbifer sp. SA54 TaxID=3401577 RepID=UPI003AAE0DEA